MGEHSVNSAIDLDARAQFIRHLIDDIRALELMLESGMIEDGVTRIGAEQEFCLINENWRPSCKALEVLEEINDSHFTTELACYNLEINLDPLILEGNCFSNMENRLRNHLTKASDAAAKLNDKVLLTGILPTISKNELELDYMTPIQRYYTLNEMMKKVRGSDFHLHIRGVDELSINHNSVLFEACNTSFQMHLQISPKDFISSYNWAQAISGPVLGICTNSPLLLGRELWSETRIALFRQSIDTRSSSYALKDQQARVNFGDFWAKGNIAEIYKNEIAEFKILISKEIESNSLEELSQGKVPKLSALSLHNGTIYRWNRACYGACGGIPHLRIENRYIPAGPSVADEMANFAFWVGLMKGRPEKFDDMVSAMNFQDARSNFMKAARTGKESIMLWDDRLISLRDLIIHELLPIAQNGLEKTGIDKDDIDKYLKIIEKRAENFTGSQWISKNFRDLRKKLKKDDALRAITQSIFEHQQDNKPVHEWKPIDAIPNIRESAEYVGSIMSTQLFTANHNDLAELATNVMLWKNIHHMPVEDDLGKLVGLLTWTHMERFRSKVGRDIHYSVRDIMTTEMITVEPLTPISEAIGLMQQNEIGCLPVIQDEHLVGIITISDVIALENDKSI